MIDEGVSMFFVSDSFNFPLFRLVSKVSFPQSPLFGKRSLSHLGRLKSPKWNMVSVHLSFPASDLNEVLSCSKVVSASDLESSRWSCEEPLTALVPWSSRSFKAL